MNSSRRWIAVLLVLPAVLLFACGDDDDIADGNSSSVNGDGTTLEGEPIVLGLIADGDLATPPSPNLGIVESGARAAAEAINANGGVAGRPIEISVCDTRADLNSAAACARDLISEGAVAFVSSASQVEAGFLPTIDDAGIASIGHFPVSEAGLTANHTFPLVSGAPGLLIGQGVLVDELGLEAPSIVRINQDALTEAVGLANMGLAAGGISVLNEVEVPPQAPDMSSYVAAATAGATDSIIALLLPQDLVSFMIALEQAGSDIPVIASSNTVLEALDQGFADEVQGVYSVGWTLPASAIDDESVQRFVDDMDRFAPDASQQDMSQNAWASVNLFTHVAAGLETIDASSVLSAMEALTDYDPGVLPPLSFDAPQSILPGLRLFSTSVLFTQVTDGEFEPLTGEFVDAFAAATSAGS